MQIFLWRSCSRTFALILKPFTIKMQANSIFMTKSLCISIKSSNFAAESKKVTYYWGTESEAQAQANAINGTGVGTASYTKAAANDPDACSALND